MADKVPRIALKEAEQLATELLGIYAPTCERLEISGSIRRRKETVGDVEILCIPHMVDVREGLFGDSIGKASQQLQLTMELLESGVLEHRLNVLGSPACGPLMQRVTFKGFAVDIFACDAKTWGCTSVVRTGSAAFSKRFATKKEQGGFMPNHLRLHGWRIVDSIGRPLDTTEEIDVFRAIGLKWVKPEDRH